MTVAYNLPGGASVLTGDELRSRRLSMQLSQRELARLLDLQPNTVARWERGEHEITMPTVLALALEQLEFMLEAGDVAPPPDGRTRAERQRKAQAND